MQTELTAIEEDTIIAILEQYALSDFDEIFKNTVGFVNKTFIVQKGKSKYVLRESHIHKKLDHLRLEIEVLKFLQDKKFTLTPKVYSNRDGEYITIFQQKYYTLQNFIPGENKASWNDLKNLNNTMLTNFFKASALFSKAIKGFYSKVNYQDKANKTLFYYMVNADQQFHNFYQKIPESTGKQLLTNSYQEILSFVAKNRKDMSKVGYNNLPKQIVHFDFHPGNVNFLGDEVSGIFDFDWVRYDSRISDIAATIAQSCWQYGGEKTGIYYKEKIVAGLQAYREIFGQSEWSVAEENALIVIALKSYMFFQLLWAMDWYKDNIKNGNEEVIETIINALLKNDYTWLFS